MDMSDLSDLVVPDAGFGAGGYVRGGNQSLLGLSFGLPWWITYSLPLFIALWSLAYITGYAPYLHRWHYTHSSGSLSRRGNTWGSFGIGMVYLFKGQTAAIDYDVKMAGKDTIDIDIGPMFSHDHTNVKALWVRRTARGRFVYQVPKSGFYHPFVDVLGFSTSARTVYTASLAATFPNAPRPLAPTDATIIQADRELQYVD